MFDAPATTSTQESASAKDTPSRKPALPRGYLALWAGLTCLAGTYLTQVSLQVINMPKLVADGDVTPAGNPNGALQAELATLRHNLGDFQRDVGRVRSEMEIRKQDVNVIADLSAIEERMSMTTGLALAKSGAAPVSAAQTVPEAAPVAAANVAVVPEAVQAQARAIALAPPALDKMMAPIETGSIPAAAAAAGKMTGQLPKATAGSAQVPAVHGQAHPAVTAATHAVATAVAPQAAAPAVTPIGFGPAVVKAEPKPFAVQLASGASLDDIRYNWSILSTQHADALAKLAPRFTSTGTPAAGQTYDLIAGPVKTAADAKKICKTLATRGMDCKVALYEGEAF